jgi:hypothetical protein
MMNRKDTETNDYTHQFKLFAESLEQHSLSFALYEAKEYRQKGNFNKAMLIVSEIVRDHITALRNIQNIFDKIHGNEQRQIVFKNFRQFEPLEVGISNAPDVFRIIDEFINPWRKVNSETVTGYLEIEKQVDFENKKTEVFARFSSIKVNSTELIEQHEKLESLIQKQKTLRHRLGVAIISLTEDILENMAVHLCEQERLKYLKRLLIPFVTMILSDVMTKAAKDIEV